MKRLRRIIASLLLISMTVSGCSAKEEASVAESSEETESSVVHETVYNRYYIEDDLPDYYDFEYPPDLAVDPSGMVLRSDLYVPIDVYEMVVSDIVDYINNGGPNGTGNTYVGREDNSGIDEMISWGDPLNSMFVGYIDIDYDGIGELAIKGPNVFQGYLNDEEATKRELYSYNSEHGVYKILGGNSKRRYIGSELCSVYMIGTDDNENVYAEYYFNDQKVPYLAFAYFALSENGTLWLYRGDYYEDELGDPDGQHVVLYGDMADSDTADEIANYYGWLFNEIYYYPRVIALADYLD